MSTALAVIPAAQSGGARGAEEVRAKLAEVLAREEFREPSSTFGDWIRDRLANLARKIADLFGVSEPAAAEAILRVLLVAVVLLVIAVLILVLRRHLVARRRGEVGVAGATRPGGDVRAAGVARLRAQAAAAAARGEHVQALRLYFRALVIGLSERGEMEYRDAWTNRELLERGSPRPEVLPVLAPLVPALDAKSFGGAPAGPEDVAEIAGLCDRLLGVRRR